MKKIDLIEFIKRSREKHSEFYDYSESIYINSKTKVKIKCPEHGYFYQFPKHHYLGSGCSKCKGVCKSNIDEFILKSLKAHGNKFSYDKAIYKNNKTEVIITCLDHGDFLQRPDVHIRGVGCSKCSNNNIQKTTFEFIKESDLIHEKKYDYSKSVYLSNKKKITITCLEHGDFIQNAGSHLRGSGCPHCGKKYGKLENIWLDSLNISNIRKQFRIGSYVVDGFDPDTNTVYEFLGDFFHGNPNRYDSESINILVGKKFGDLYNKTKLREEYLSNLGYNYVYIWESDFIHHKILSKNES